MARSRGSICARPFPAGRHGSTSLGGALLRDVARLATVPLVCIGLRADAPRVDSEERLEVATEAGGLTRDDSVHNTSGDDCVVGSNGLACGSGASEVCAEAFGGPSSESSVAFSALAGVAGSDSSDSLTASAQAPCPPDAHEGSAPLFIAAIPSAPRELPAHEG